MVLAFGSKVTHRYSTVSKLLPLVLAHGWGYGSETFDSAAIGLASVTPAGALAPGFGKDGVTITQLPRGNYDYAVVTALVRDRSGRLLVVGWRTKSTLLDANTKQF